MDSNNIDELQNSLHRLTSSYLNGGFSKRAFLLYPVSRQASNENILLAKKIAALARGNQFPGQSAIPQIISSSYSYLEKSKKKRGSKIIKKKCQSFSLSDYSMEKRKYLLPVAKLAAYAQEKLRPYLLGFYVHGSIATDDFVRGWSDLDTFAIVRKDSLSDPAKIERLRHLLYKARIYQHQIDPLQHHGHHLVTEYDLENYPEDYMPIDTLRRARSLFETDEEISFGVRDSTSLSLSIFKWFSDDLKAACRNKLGLGGAGVGNYALKFFLHKLLLYPSLYLSAKGKHMYKKFSFGKARHEFSDDAWNSIRIASNARSKWRNITDTKPITTALSYNPVLAYQINSVLCDLVVSLARKNGIDTVALANATIRLVDEAQKNIKAATIERVQR